MVRGGRGHLESSMVVWGSDPETRIGDGYSHVLRLPDVVRILQGSWGDPHTCQGQWCLSPRLPPLVPPLQLSLGVALWL